MSDYTAIAIRNTSNAYIRLHNVETGEQFEIGPTMELHLYLTDQGGVDLLEILDVLLEDELLPEHSEELPGGYVDMDEESYDG